MKKLRLFVLTCLVALFGTTAFAQDGIRHWVEQHEGYARRGETPLVSILKIGEGEAYLLDQAAVAKIYKEQKELLRISLPHLKGIHLELLKRDIFAEGVTFKDKPVSYQGILSDDDGVLPKSWVSLVVFKDEVSLFFTDGTFDWEYIRQPDHAYLLKNVTFKNDKQFSCSEKTCTSHIDQSEEATGTQKSFSATTTCSSRTVRIFYEITNAHLRAYNNDTTRMYRDLWSTTAISYGLYQNENINLVTSGYYTWTTRSNYDTCTTSLSALTLFSANRTRFNGDIAHLITTGRGMGGRAQINTRTLAKYGLTDLNGGGIFSGTGFGWGAMCIGHEIGHNLSSPHTHECEWNGNNTPIDGFGPTCFSNTVTITCATGPVNVPGTLMSYAHGCAIGMSLSAGLGPQPRAKMQTAISNTSRLCPQSVSISPSLVNVSGAGGTSSLTVTCSGCWNVSNGSFTQTVTDVFAGNGNGSFVVTVTANPNATSRREIVTVTSCANPSVSATFTVLQSAGARAFQVSPASLNLSRNAGVANLSVTGFTGNYTITAAGNTSMATLPASPSSSATYNVSISANAGAARSVTLTFTNAGVSRQSVITQDPNPIVTLSPPTGQASSAAGTITTVLTTTIPVTATAASGMTVSPQAFLAGTHIVTFSYPSASSSVNRTCPFAGFGATATYTLVQSGPAQAFLRLPTSITLSASGGSEVMNVSATPGLAWSTTAPSWLTLTPRSGIGPGTVAVSALANTNAGPNTAAITATAVGVPSAICNVTQLAQGSCSDIHEPNPTAAAARALALGVRINACITIGDVDYYSIVINGVTFIVKVTGIGNAQTGAYSIEARLSGSTLTVELFEVGNDDPDMFLELLNGTTLLGSDDNKNANSLMPLVNYNIPACSFSLSTSSLSFANTGGSRSFTINTSGPWTASTSLGSLSSTSGSGNQTLTLNLGSNSNSSSQNGSISVVACNRQGKRVKIISR